MPLKKRVTRKSVKNPRVERTRANGTFTEARYWGFVRSALRKAWLRWPPRYAALNAAESGIGKLRRWRCAICDGDFLKKDVEVDHFPVACGSLKDYDDLPRFVKTLYCEADNLRVVCKTCHKAHTKQQREDAKEKRDA